MHEQFSYLLPDETLKLMSIKEQNIMTYQDNKRIRLVYENCEFDQQQLKQIEKFRIYAKEKNVDLVNVPDSTILRYLYSFDFQPNQSLEKLFIYLEWYADPIIQRQDSTTLQLINQGAIYTYGRDISSRPIIYLNVSLLDMQKYTLVDYLASMNQVMTLVVQKMFIKGKLQNYLFVIDMGNKSITSLPLSTVKEMVLKLSYVYSMRMGKLLLVNCNTVTKLMYSAMSPFLADITKEKIKILSQSQVQKGKMRLYVDQSQLEKKYQGRLENLGEKWPPRIPGKQFRAIGKKNEHHIDHEKQFMQPRQFDQQKMIQQYGQSQNVTRACCSSSQCVIY